MMRLKWKKYIPVVVLVLFSSKLFQNSVNDFFAATGEVVQTSVWDVVTEFWKGSVPYSLRNTDMPFDVPGIWFLYLVYYFALMGRVMGDMFRGKEYQYTIRYMTRTRWYYRQLGKIAGETIKYLLVTYAVFCVCGLIFGISLELPNLSVQMNLFGVDLTGVSTVEIMLATTVIPFCVMSSLACAQYVVTLKVNNLVGLLVPIVILVSSAFYMGVPFMGNYLMLVLYGELSGGVICVRNGIALSLVIAIVAVLIGRRIIQRKDLL